MAMRYVWQVLARQMQANEETSEGLSSMPNVKMPDMNMPEVNLPNLW